MHIFYIKLRNFLCLLHIISKYDCHFTQKVDLCDVSWFSFFVLSILSNRSVLVNPADNLNSFLPADIAEIPSQRLKDWLLTFSASLEARALVSYSALTNKVQKVKILGKFSSSIKYPPKEFPCPSFQLLNVSLWRCDSWSSAAFSQRTLTSLHC